ncbi:Ubiquitin carboxyl-terminal hydrolase 25 [Castilleja foliolosa]|uniref:Ubiquitin carboxyl-terminal hydrolase n=1 Tax=Castilleja foliolosa TaxID=1961234 RepID=A0ABD3B8P4_9LAMI
MAMLQMTWQPGLLKSLKRKHGSPPLGLRNLGNSCYLNSVLQCLTYTPPLANFCLRYLHSSACDSKTVKGKKGECPFCILERRIALSLSSESVSDAPLRINNSLRLYAEHFRTGRQEDAHEFLRYVIDACHNTCLRLKKLQQQQQRGKVGTANGGDISGSTDTVVKEIFGGALQSQVKCLSCGAESNKIDEIMDISLDILHSGSLKEALQKFFQPEVLNGNNKYKCDNCKELVAARKQMSVLQAPNVLVIQLKRFEGTFGGKVDKAIAFDNTLVLSSHMCKGTKAKDLTSDLHPEFDLFGTIVHSGFSPDSGHYYAYIKNATGGWYCCNDSYVSVTTLQEVLSEKAYMLFFSRTKPRPRTSIDMVNGSKSHESNGSKTSVTHKSGCLKVSDNHSKANGLTNLLASNNTKAPKVQRSEHAERPASMKVLSDNYSEGSTSVTYLGSDCINSTDVLELGAHVKPVRITESSNHHSQKNNSMKSEVGSGNTKFVVCKKESSVENGYTAADVQINKKEPSSLFINNGENGHITVDFKDRISEANGLQNGDITGSASSCMKRKIENGPSSIFLARDDQSRAEVEEFKEVIEKEASVALRSCEWYEEVQCFMRATKKLCQEAGNAPSNDLEMKNLLFSQAKRNYLSKVPESLKARLVEQLRLFSQEKKSFGT